MSQIGPEISERSQSGAQALSGHVHPEIHTGVRRELIAPAVQALISNFNPAVQGQLSNLNQATLDQHIWIVAALLEAPPNTWIQLSDPPSNGKWFVRGLSGDYASAVGVAYGGVIESVKLLSGVASAELASAALVSDLERLEEARKSIAGFALPISIAGCSNQLVRGRTDLEESLPIGTTISDLSLMGIFLPEWVEGAYKFAHHYLKLVDVYRAAGLELIPESEGMQFYSGLKELFSTSADASGVFPRDFEKRVYTFMREFEPSSYTADE